MLPAQLGERRCWAGLLGGPRCSFGSKFSDVLGRNVRGVPGDGPGTLRWRGETGEGVTGESCSMTDPPVCPPRAEVRNERRHCAIKDLVWLREIGLP